MKVFKVEKIDTHGGSIRAYVSKNRDIIIDKSVEQILVEEEEFGIKKISTYLEFGKKIEKLKINIRENIKKIKKKYKKVIGYGAPAKATTLLNYFNISSEIDFIIEDNELKHEKFVPGVNIKIVSKDKIKDKNNAILVLAWNFFEDIKKNNKDIGKNFINIKSLE